MDRIKERTKNLFLYALIGLVLILLLNVRTLTSYFIDEDFIFVHATFDKDLKFFTKLFYTDYARQIFPELANWKNQGFIRPLYLLSFKLDFLLYGNNATGYHLTNIVWHYLTTILVFLIIDIISGNKALGFLGGLLYGVNPIHSQVLGPLSGRSESITGFFYLLSFYCYVRYRTHNKKEYYFLALISFFIALFTKETAVTLPVLLMGYDLWDRYLASDKPSLRESMSALFQASKKYVWTWTPYLALLVLYFLIRSHAFGNFIGGYSPLDFDMVGKATHVINSIRYAFLASAMSPYDFTQSFQAPTKAAYLSPFTSWHEVILAALIVSLILLPSCAVRLRNSPHARLLGLGVLWMVISYVPVLFNATLLPCNLYIPFVGGSFVLITLIFSVYRNKKVAGLVVIFFILTYATYQVKYNSDWAYAGIICKQVKETIEHASNKFKEGDLIILGDLPRFYKTAWVCPDGNFQYALKEPFTRSDLTTQFNMVEFLPDQIHEVKPILETSRTSSTIDLRLSPLSRPKIGFFKVELHRCKRGRVSSRSSTFRRLL